MPIQLKSANHQTKNLLKQQIQSIIDSEWESEEFLKHVENIKTK